MSINIYKFTRDDMINARVPHYIPDSYYIKSETVDNHDSLEIHTYQFNKWQIQLLNFVAVFYKYESQKTKPEKNIKYALSPRYFTYIDLTKPEIKHLNSDIVKLFSTPSDAVQFYKDIITPMFPDFKTDVIHLNDYHFVVVIDIWN